MVKMTFHVMIIPTLNCPSNCKYCWGSENKKEMMDIEIIDQIIDWLSDFRDDKVHFTFHGGEPLLAGYIGEKEGTDYIYYFKQNKFTRLGDKSSMILYPYRAYFRKVDGVYKGAKIAEFSILVIGEDGSTTDITNAIFGDGEGDGKIYDLNGIRVMQPVKGRLYIVNGQKKVYR